MPKFMKAIGNFMAKRMRKESKAAIGVTPYAYADLTKLHRIEANKFAGAGDIVLGLSDLESSTLYRMVGLDNVVQAESTIREKVLHAAVDELLSGKRSLADLRRGTNETTGGPNYESALLPPERTIADVMAASTMTANAKKHRSALAAALAEVPEELRKKVEAELTRGEEILWIARPHAQLKGRGVVAVVSKVKRKEPVYELYALTNRRALVWASKDTSIDTSDTSEKFGGAGNMALRGPLSYYSTDLTSVGLEEDERIDASGGSIIFKSVRVTIKTEKEESTHGRGPARVKTTYRYENHYFGIMRIRNVHAVMRLLYERLIAPCR